MSKLGLILGIATTLMTPYLLHAEDALKLTVSSGKFDRFETPTFFDLPAGATATSWQLRDDAGTMLPVQLLKGEKRGIFILPELKAGLTRTYTLLPATGPATDEVLVKRDGKFLKISVDGKEVIQFAAQEIPPPEGVTPEFQRGGYISAVFAPSGKLVSDDYPKQHKHHHGIWWAWTKASFEGRATDFWNMGDKKGKVEPVGEPSFESGPVFGHFSSAQAFIDLTAPKPVVALNEKWDVWIYRVGKGEKKVSLFELVSKQECATDAPLKLPKYHYGGVGYRGSKEWDGAEKTFFLTSEGKTRVNGNATRGRWCHVGGMIDGALAGIAILDHPANFQHPQPMRLNPTEPFFCFAPSQAGDWEIASGKPYVSRYRFAVSDGAPEKGEIERLWNDFASPPEVQVK